MRRTIRLMWWAISYTSVSGVPFDDNIHRAPCLLDRVLLHGLLGCERVSIYCGTWHGNGPWPHTNFDRFLLHVFALHLISERCEMSGVGMHTMSTDFTCAATVSACLDQGVRRVGSRVPSSFSLLLSSLTSAMVRSRLSSCCSRRMCRS